MALTPQQEKFCQAIVKGMNQSDAYRSAYNTSNMKSESIHRKAKEVMDNGKIAARIKELSAPVVKKLQITAEDVLQSLLDIRSMALDKERLNDALKANELLGKHLKLFTDKMEMDVDIKYNKIEIELVRPA